MVSRLLDYHPLKVSFFYKLNSKNKALINAFSLYFKYLIFSTYNCTLIVMSEKVSVLLSDVTIKGDIVEKEKLITDSKIDGDITSDKLITHQGSKLTGNINSSDATLGGTSKGNINSDKINIKSTAQVEGVLNQKNLSIEEGAKLKIKAETY